jgi:competence protein ComEC
VTRAISDPAPAPHPAPRLFAAALACALGALAGEALAPPPGLLLGLGLGAGAVLAVSGLAPSARPRLLRALVVPGAALVLGLVLAGLRMASLQRSALAAGARAGADALLEGTVLTDPVPEGRGVRVVLGVFRAEIDGRPFRVRERVLLALTPPRRLEAGDRLAVDARLAPLARPGARPAVRASAARWRRQGVAARGRARAGGVRPLPPGVDPLAAVARVGRRAVARAAASLPARERGLLLGVTIGDTSSLDPGLEEDFRVTGLAHLTAVSGANVAMFLGAVALLLRVVRAGRRLRIAVLGAAILAFMAIARFEPSVLRAGAMTAAALLGLAAGARREALVALAAAVLGLLVHDPFLARSVGFQLSALATFGILTLAPRLARLAGGGRLAAAAAVTLGAQLAVAPIVALHFHTLSLVALPANLLALPAVAPATVLGFAAAALGSVAAPLGGLAAALARPALAWMAGVAAAFARLPGASVGLPGGPAGAALVGLLACLPVALLRARRPPRGAPFVLALALVAATAAWARAFGPPPLAGLVLTALDVGQGDAFLLRTPTGATMLVDGGPDEARILAKLRAHGVRRIDLLVLTHPHADHVDGLPAVVARYPVGRAIEPGLDDDRPALRAFRDGLRMRGVPLDVVRRGARYALGEATVTVLGPAALLTGTDSDLNNNSVVLRVDHGGTCILLSGEVQEEGQQALLAHPEDLRCPAMTVPHHGSGRMLPEYFARAAPRLAVVSVGAGNEFGHPAGETLAALAAAGARVLRTDRSGDVSVGVGPGGAVDVRLERAEDRAA